LGREPGGGLVVVPDGSIAQHIAPIILAAARSNVPAVFWPSDMTLPERAVCSPTDPTR
jgi:hypothetical protein